MKKILNTDLPITLTNLAWRLLVPLFVLEVIGIFLDNSFHFNLFFKVSFAIFSVCITIWGISVTAKEAIHTQKE